MNDTDRQVYAEYRAVFARYISEQSPATLTRLRAARRAAVQELRPASDGPAGLANWYATAGIATLVTAFAIYVAAPVKSDREAAAAALGAADASMLIDAGSIEVIEDARFYAWVDREMRGSAATQATDEQL